MPTVHEEHGFKVRIFPADHPPAHVHVYKAGGVVVVNLDPVGVREVKGTVKAQDVVQAVRVVEGNVAKLLGCWRKIHG